MIKMIDALQKHVEFEIEEQRRLTEFYLNLSMASERRIESLKNILEQTSSVSEDMREIDSSIKTYIKRSSSFKKKTPEYKNYDMRKKNPLSKTYDKKGNKEKVLVILRGVGPKGSYDISELRSILNAKGIELSNPTVQRYLKELIAEDIVIAGKRKGYGAGSKIRYSISSINN